MEPDPGRAGPGQRGIGKAVAALKAGGAASGWAANLFFVVSAVALGTSGVIHLYLWDTGVYRSIPTIGPLFLLQAIAALVLAVVVVLARRVWAALAGAVLAASTIGGFLLVVTIGLFGFTDSWSAPFATPAFVAELATVVLGMAGSALCFRNIPVPTTTRRSLAGIA
jgi:hypothetical protein